MNSLPRSLALRLVFLCVCAWPGVLCAAAPHTRTPVVFATDIGGDIDDTWALAMLLRSPELDLKMVLTETGEARYRAIVAAKFLEASGRTDVAVALGRTFGTMEEKDRVVSPWVRGCATTISTATPARCTRTE
jgi:inosine-uridine nucleoside N-ribohydrolase